MYEMYPMRPYVPQMQEGQEVTEAVKPLSRKHEKFINEYLKCWNGTRAYMRVYPNAAYDSARSKASELLANDNIQAVLSERMAEAHMSADEALEILAAHARGDIGKFADRLGQLDLQSAKDAGISRLIKKFKQKTITKIGKGDTDDDTEIHDVEIELYDAQAAAEKILRIHGKFVDKHEITGKDGADLIPKEADDTRREILRKLDGIAAATGADAIPKLPE